MSKRKFQQTLESILKDDSRYAVGAYVFVRMALDFTVKRLCAQDPRLQQGRQRALRSGKAHERAPAHIARRGHAFVRERAYTLRRGRGICGRDHLGCGGRREGGA